jgi:hypothetical protein
MVRELTGPRFERMESRAEASGVATLAFVGSVGSGLMRLPTSRADVRTYALLFTGCWQTETTTVGFGKPPRKQTQKQD